MRESRFEKYAPLSGLIGTLLLMAAAALYGVFEYLPASDELQEIVSENDTRVYLSGYIGTVAAFFLIWFAGSVYSALRKVDSDRGRLSMLAFGGGIAAGLTVALGFSIIVTAGARAGAAGGISAIEAVTLNDVYGQILGGTYAVSMAVFIGATGAVSLRSDLFPNWFGWASVIVAVGLLTPFAYAVLALALVWLILMSIWLYQRGPMAG